VPKRDAMQGKLKKIKANNRKRIVIVAAAAIVLTVIVLIVSLGARLLKTHKK
jgi:hypothetical protein